MQTLKSLSILSPSHFNHLHFNPIKPYFFLFSFISSHTQKSLNRNFLLFDYLIKTFNFSKTEALSISNSFSRIKSLEKPQSVVQYLQNLGFSNTQIKSSVHGSPHILFSNIDKTLKPKIRLFQDLGLVGFDLGKFISKNSTLLTVSLERKLVPCIEIIQKVLVNDENNQDLIMVLRRCSWILSKDPKERLLCNIAFFESCGIIGSQLSMLLKRQPRLFVVKESVLKDLVSRVLDMGFSVDSRMLVHGLYRVSCLSNETFERKLELFRRFGFLENECIEMFRRTPGLLMTSEEKLKFGIEFFFNTIKFNKAMLVHRPTCLMNSMEKRVIPRYRVLQVIKLKRLLKKEPSFFNVLDLTEGEFLEKFVAKFRDDAEELLVAYKGHMLSSEEEEEEES